LADPEASGESEIVRMDILFAIGDLHGDLERAHAALAMCGLANQTHWTGGRATLVQTGDLVDRGRSSLQVIALFDALEQQARESGGKCTRLLGNHELLNMQGDFRYVHPSEMSAVGPGAWRGMFDPRVGALAQRLIAQQPVATVAGAGGCRTLFIHAGLHPRHLRPKAGASWPEQQRDLNARVAAQLQRAREGGGDLLGGEGPLWYRGYAEYAEGSVCAQLRTVLDAAGAWRMVVGHTITPDHKHVNVRCGGMLHMIDVGMSSAYYGSLAAWTCQPRHDLGPGWVSASALYPNPSRRRPAEAREGRLGGTSAAVVLQTVYVPRAPRAGGRLSTRVHDDGASQPWARAGAADVTTEAVAACAHSNCAGISLAGDVGGDSSRSPPKLSVFPAAHIRWAARRGADEAHAAALTQA